MNGYGIKSEVYGLNELLFKLAAEQWRFMLLGTRAESLSDGDSIVRNYKKIIC